MPKYKNVVSKLIVKKQTPVMSKVLYTIMFSNYIISEKNALQVFLHKLERTSLNCNYDNSTY